MTTASIANPTRHERRVVKAPPMSGPIAAAMAPDGPDHREDLGLHLPVEVAVDQRLHRGEIERSAEAADHGPEDDDRGEALREHHRDGAQRIEDEAGDVSPLAAEEVAQLAADHDEGG